MTYDRERVIVWIFVLYFLCMVGGAVSALLFSVVCLVLGDSTSCL